MTNNVLQNIEGELKVGFEDVVTFFKSDLWPVLVAVAKDVEKADVEALLPFATTAIGDIAGAAGGMANPAMIGGAVASVLEQIAPAAGKALTTATIGAALTAVQSVLVAQTATPVATPAPQ
jgi:hypothetical protein